MLDLKAWLLLVFVFLRDVRLTTSVVLSMKSYGSEQEVMDFQFCFALFVLFFLKKGVFVCFSTASVIWTTTSEESSAWVQQRLIPNINDMIFTRCRLLPAVTTSPPNASDSVSHLFSATAISHGLDTRVLLQRNPYNRLTVIKETSLQSNKISNFQLTRDAFQLVVLFASSLSFCIFFPLCFSFHFSSCTLLHFYSSRTLNPNVKFKYPQKPEL